MDPGYLNNLEINPRIISAIKKAGFSSTHHVLESSYGELKNKTGLADLDLQWLIKIASKQCSPSYVSGLDLFRDEIKYCKERGKCIRTGCRAIDLVLRGGIQCGGITELSGESGCGKTQFGIQLAIQCQKPIGVGGLGRGVAYICTEGQFPISRLHQMLKCRGSNVSYNGKEFTDNIFVHHIPDMETLLECIRFQLPQLLSTKSIGLIVVDSIAAVFRAAEETQDIKSKTLQQLAYKLHSLADKHYLAVLAINQVSSFIDDDGMNRTGTKLVPALGLSWSNMITTRLMLCKTSYEVYLPELDSNTSTISSASKRARLDVHEQGKTTINQAKPVLTSVRQLDVVFCPWLPQSSASFIVAESGLIDVEAE